MNIQDARGTVHSLMQPAQRIVSLVPSATETLYQLGLADRIVGITRFCVHPQPWVKGIPKVGGTKDVNITKVLELHPDLVVGNCEENTREIFSALDSHVPVWAPFPKTIPDAIADLTHLGQLTHTEALAMQFVQRASAAWHVAQQNAEPFTYAYFIWRRPWMSISDDTFIARMLETVGGINIFGDRKERFPEINLDALAERNPDVVLLSSEPFPFKKQHQVELAQHAGIPQDAVRFIDGEYASWHGHRMIDALQYLSVRAPFGWDSMPV